MQDGAGDIVPFTRTVLLLNETANKARNKNACRGKWTKRQTENKCTRTLRMISYKTTHTFTDVLVDGRQMTPHTKKPRQKPREREYTMIRKRIHNKNTTERECVIAAGGPHVQKMLTFVFGLKLAPDGDSGAI